MGFGAVDASSLIGTDDYIMTKSEAGQVVIANIPQAVYSLIYLLFNNILTRMLLAYEWSHLSLKKKPLRVSSPIGKQRSTYFLQLPFRYALPLLTLSAIMHWLVSQGLFFVKFRVVAHGTPVDTSAHTLGWSAIAIIFVLICGSLMTLAVILLGFRSYPVGIPFARSCSRVIAAACHNQDGARVRLEALQWGDVGEGTTTGVRHCTFSDEVVRMPQEGVRYAGCAKDDMTRRNQGKRGSWE